MSKSSYLHESSGMDRSLHFSIEEEVRIVTQLGMLASLVAKERPSLLNKFGFDGL